MSQAQGQTSKAASLLVVGSVGLDTVETRAGKRNEVLGGAASYFSVAASFLAPVRLTAVVGTDFPDAHTSLLQSHGVDLDGLERAVGRTFRWSGVYSPDFATRTTLDTQLNVFESFRPKLPPAWTDSEYVFLANIDPTLQLGVLEQARRPKFVACDTMNFWIEGKRPELLRLLERVDMLLLNDEEARQLSGHGNLPAAARAIRKLGPRAVVIKRGDAGALLFHEGGVFAAPAFPIEEVVDPTGAGDSFAGGFMGWLAHENDSSPTTIRTAMILGSVLASFSVEDFSLDRFRRLDLTQIRERFTAFADLMHFEKIKLTPPDLEDTMAANPSKSDTTDDIDTAAVIAVLNRILELELAGVVRYLHYSFMIFGHNRIPICGWLRAQSVEGQAHAVLAGEHITTLDGHPSLKIGELLETQKHSVDDILKEAAEHEKEGLAQYRKLLELTQGRRIMLEEYARAQIALEEQHLAEIGKMTRRP